ncbi:MAG: DUF362 domain-containing protein [candidate division WOR-3 bacterium]
MKKMIRKLSFPVIGLLSLIWFLIRVIPKPSRARYPCMKVAAPLASTFFIYLIGITSSLFVFKKAKQYLYKSKYVVFSILLLLSSVLFIATFLNTDEKVYASFRSSVLEGPNQPMGEGKGINPGRVVWIWDPDATDENCTNESGDYWWQDNNTDQTVVNTMVSDALKMLTDEESDSEAWDAIFHDYNQSHERGDVGYVSGEKIVIKINLNSSVSYGGNTVDTSPHIVLAILNQLINVVGVAEGDISIGDPGRSFTDLYWDKIHSVFPDVKYWGTGGGRTPIEQSDDFEMFTSDDQVQDYLPKCYLEADYMINIPVFKKHHRAGISLSSKNHFGTFVPFSGNANHWHYSLPCTEGNGIVDNGDYGVYRCFVDIMGHEHLGGKTILYIFDGLWSSTNWSTPPIKWRMAPFNNDWPSSIFVSQDPVAIESVGFDFFYQEFDEDHPTEGNPTGTYTGPFPRYAGVDDFLHQAADSSNWTDEIPFYDPEGDGTRIPWSLGVHEHWNNATEMRYSRNLGENEGIELVSNYEPSGVEENIEAVKVDNHCNLFNTSATIQFVLPAAEFVRLEIYNLSGQKIETLVEKQLDKGNYNIEWNPEDLVCGTYIYRIKAGEFSETNKLIFIK